MIPATLQQKAKQIWPGLSANELDTALWSLTTYPTGNESLILSDLKTAYNKSGGDLWQALNQADEERTARMQRGH